MKKKVIFRIWFEIILPELEPQKLLANIKNADNGNNNCHRSSSIIAKQSKQISQENKIKAYVCTKAAKLNEAFFIWIHQFLSIEQ